MKSKTSIEVIGDSFADVYCYLESGLPTLGGDSRLIEPIHTAAGGSGLNTATHLASLIRYFSEDHKTDTVSLQTAINEHDHYGKMIIGHAKQHDFRLINRRVSNVPNCFIGTAEAKKLAAEKSTGHCAVIVANNDRSFMTHLGCMEDFRGSHIMRGNISSECAHQHIHIAGYFNIPGFWDGELAGQLQLIKDDMRKEGKQLTISLVPQHDATGVWDGGLDEVLKHVDFLILNELEAKSIAGCVGETDETVCIKAIAKHFNALNPKLYAIVTNGARGAAAFHLGNMILSQSTPRQISNPVDPTGAGDAFAAGFIYGLLEQHENTEMKGELRLDEIKQALRWGCSMGTCNVMVQGASTPCSKQNIKVLLSEMQDSKK